MTEAEPTGADMAIGASAILPALELALAWSNDPCAIVTPDLHLAYANAAFLAHFGHHHSPPLQIGGPLLVGPSTSAAPQAVPWQQALVGATIRQVDAGPPRAEVLYQPVVDTAGAITHAVGIWRLGPMPVLLSALGRIGRVLAHDLRNPLGAIRNACHVLRQQLPSSDPVWIDYLSLIDQQAADCDRLLARRLGWSRTWEIAPATVEVGPWLRALLADTTLPSPVKPLLQVVPADLRIVTDPQRLRLILETLIRNATDALQDARGQLSVTVQHRGLEIVLIVADNGPGIPAPIRPILFEPLASTKPSGLGLGLWIARQLAQQLGGSLTWEPTAEGTTMVVTVPPLLAGTF